MSHHHTFVWCVVWIICSMSLVRWKSDSIDQQRPSWRAMIFYTVVINVPSWSYSLRMRWAFENANWNVSTSWSTWVVSRREEISFSRKIDTLALFKLQLKKRSMNARVCLTYVLTSTSKRLLQNLFLHIRSSTEPFLFNHRCLYCPYLWVIFLLFYCFNPT